jgi:hypothetical protein
VRKVLAPICLLLTAFAAGGLVASSFTLFSVMLLLLSGYRIFNNVRITEERMHEGYLRRATRRTSLRLAAMQALIALAWLGWHAGHVSGQTVWMVLTGLQLAVALVLLASTMRRLNRTAWQTADKHMADVDLPTVTVAIPARNETEDLQACLHSVLASNYPKLEVLVLDDCSQTRRTPEIIRGFAQGGVRFIQGEQPHDTWLPKNQAYDRLARSASGQYILFCGVDVRFGPDSIRQLIELTLARDKTMVGVLPWRSHTARGFALTQAMRYWWELVPPRRLFRRPAVLSTLWLIRRDALAKAGGFAAARRTIVPEAYFARHAASQNDGYSFMRASQASAIESVKSSEAQRETAVRTRYPQLHRRPENVAALTLIELVLVALPYVLSITGFWLHIGVFAHVLAVLACVALTVTYQLATLTTRTGNWWFGMVGALAGQVYDVGLLHYSMWRYEFSTVDWKGRNVCVPAMHVIPHLPKI